MKKRSKLISTLLAAALLLGSSMPAAADTIETSAAPVTAGSSQTNETSVETETIETNETSGATDNEQSDEMSGAEETVLEDGQLEAEEEAIIPDSVEAEEDIVEVQTTEPTENKYENPTSESTDTSKTDTNETSGETISDPVVYVEIDNASGWFLSTVSGIDGEKVSKVQVAAWSDNNWQDDLVWYDSVKRDDGTYAVNTNLYNHNFDTGKYYFDTYITDKNGKRTCIGSKTAEFTVSAGKAVVEKVSNGYKASIENIVIPGGVQKVRCAVWSDKGGQDDLKWYDCSYNSKTRSAELIYSSSDFNTIGKYFVDIYGINASGKSIYLGGTTYEVIPSKAESVYLEIDNASGWFLVDVKGAYSDFGVKNVKVAVWSKKNGQDDLMWYTAQKLSNGIYRVNTNIVYHSFETGLYYFDTYVYDTAGNGTCVSSQTKEFTAKNSDITVKTLSDNMKYSASISDVEIPGGIRSVSFAVWSKENGQDDLKWYTAKKSGNTYSAGIDIYDHKTAGGYYIDAYAETNAGAKVYLATSTDLSIKVSVNGTASVINENTEKGSFDISLKINEASPSVSSAKIAVWSKADQNDLHWYNAVKQDDGSYKCTAYLYNHKFNSGTYNIHAYVTLSNGIESFAAGTTYKFSPSSYLNVYGSSINGTKTALFKPAANYSKVQFAVWNEHKGQNGTLKWYNASKQADGTWTAVLNYNNHKAEGNYIIHVYADGKAVAASTFSFMSPDSFDIAYLSVAAEIANDESHGYKLIEDDEIYSGEFDCSSFVGYCLMESGYYPGANLLPTSTREMREELTKLGFVAKPFSYESYLAGDIELQPGDVLLYENPGNYGHVEFYIGNGKTIGAHADENWDPAPGDQSGLEISIYSFEQNHSYNYYLRDPDLAAKL